MAMASSLKTATDETPQEDRIWMKLQSIVVQSRLGQTVLKFMDNFLWIVEKCAEWSLPRQEVGDENRKDSGKPELIRPLPWLLFLPSLVFLRVIRVVMNIGASILDYPAITPSEMVKFVQICRRYLNSASNKGIKDSKDKKPSINEARKTLIKSIRLILSSLSCLDTSKPSLSPPPTKIYFSSILDPDLIKTPTTTISEEKSVTESMDSTIKLQDSTSESEEEEKETLEEKETENKETLNEKIDRLALENSEDDEDFDPAKYRFLNDTNSDEDSDDSNVSTTEIHDIIEDTLSLTKVSKNNIEQFLNSEKTCTPTFQQEIVEPVCEKRSSAKESRDNVEERLATSQRIDSPECYTSDRSSQEGDPIFYSPISSDSDTPKEFSVSSMLIAEQCTTREVLKTDEFINGEALFILASTSSSESKSSEETNNGVVVPKHSTNASKSHKGKRTSHSNRKKK